MSKVKNSIWFLQTLVDSENTTGKYSCLQHPLWECDEMASNFGFKLQIVELIMQQMHWSRYLDRYVVESPYLSIYWRGEMFYHWHTNLVDAIIIYVLLICILQVPFILKIMEVNCEHIISTAKISTYHISISINFLSTDKLMWERLKTILIQLTQNNKTITFNVSINVDIYLIYTRHEMMGPHTASVACFIKVILSCSMQ